MLAVEEAFCTMIINSRKYDRLGRVTGHGQVQLARNARPVGAFHQPEKLIPLSASFSSRTAYACRLRRLMRCTECAHTADCVIPPLSGPSIPGQASVNISFSRRSTTLRSWRPNLTSHEVVLFYFGYIRVTIADQFRLLSLLLLERGHTNFIFHTCPRLNTRPDDS